MNERPIGRSGESGGGSQGPTPAGQAHEASGRTVDEAIEQGLVALGVGRSQVEIEVVDEGSRGILGLGGREARIRLTLKPGSPAVMPEWASYAKDIANQILSLMGVSAEVTSEVGSESIRINLEGADVGPLIGKHGQTLGALEMLLAVLVGRAVGAHVRVELDAEGYRERRQASLEDLARRAADRAVRQGREIALTPMGPRDRRIIHVTLQDHPHVGTVSRGERDARRVVVVPKDGSRRQRGPDEGQPGGLEGRPRDADPVDEELEGESQVTGRVGRTPEGGRSRSSQRRTGPETGRRAPRRGVPGTFGRRSQAPRPPAPKAARPDGLPSDEELEAEIEAYLARTRPGGTKGTDAPSGEGSNSESRPQDDGSNEDEE